MTLVRWKWETSAVRRLPPVKIYINHLRDIIALVTSGGEEVSIFADEYRASSFDDLASLPSRRVRELEVRTEDPMLLISLGPDDLFLLGAVDDPVAKPRFDKLHDLLQSRKRRAATLVDRYIGLWIVLLGLSGLNGPLFVLGADSERHTLAFDVAVMVFSCLSLIGLVGVAAYTWLNRRSKALVYLCLPHEQSFWLRNGDKLLVGAIGALVSVIISYGVTTLLAAR